MAPGFPVCSRLVNKLVFAYMSVFVSRDAHISLIISNVNQVFFPLNNEISGKDLRAVGCMLPE